MADDSKELEAQLSLNQAINKAIADRQAMLRAQNQTLSDQARISEALTNALRNAGAASDSATEGGDALTEALRRAQQAAGGASDNALSLDEALRRAQEGANNVKKSTQNVNKTFEKSIRNAKSFGDLLSALGDTSPIDLMGDAFKDAEGNVTAFGVALGAITFDDIAQKAKSTFGILTNSISTAFSAIKNIGMGVFGALSAGMDFLGNAAKDLANAGTEVANAWENVKDKLGTIGPAAESARQVVDELGQAGASNSQVFGTGPGGLANRIEYAGEVLEHFQGRSATVISGVIRNTDNLQIANMSLGISMENLGQMQRNASIMGEDFGYQLEAQARQTVHLAKEFGVSERAIGKNIDAMISDFGTFGGLSQEALSATAAYAAKLGVEIQTLQGIVGKTDDFEGAAQAASELAATFGMNIDAMELMTADPAEKIDMMRQAFDETGQSFADMSRQEKQRLADLMANGDVKSLSGMLDPSNMDVDFSSFEDASAAATAGAVSQEEANLILADSIKKLHEQMNHLANASSPFGAFIQGIVTGIMNSEEMREALSNLAQVMNIAFRSGRELADLIIDMFPGVDDLLTGLSDFFDPGRWQTMFDEMMTIFTDFFEMLSVDPVNATQNMLDRMQELFTNFFEHDSLETLKRGAIAFITAFGGIIAGAIPWITEKVVEMIQSIANILSGQGSSTSDPNTIGGALSNAFAQAFAALLQAIPPLASALFDALGQVLMANSDKVALVGAALGVIFAAQMAISVAKAVAIEWAKNKILGMMTNTAQETVNEAAAETDSAVADRVVPSFNDLLQSIKQIEPKDIVQAGLRVLLIAAFIGTGLVMLVGAMAIAAAIMIPIPFEAVIKAFIAVATAIGATYAIAQAGKHLKPNVLAQGGLGLLAGALFLAVAGGAFALAIKAIDYVIGDMDFLRVVALFGMLALAVGATFLLALAGAALVSDGGITISFGALGLVLGGSLFLAAAGVMYGLALKAIIAVFDGIDLMRAIGIMGTLITAVGTTMLLAIAGAGLAVGGLLLAVGIPGLMAGAEFLVIAADEFAPALASVVKTVEGAASMDKIERALGILRDSMTLITDMAVMAAAFRLFAGVVGILQDGLVIAGDFAVTGFKQVGRVLDAINDIPITDPERTQAAVEITGTIVEALAAIGDLGISMAGMGVVSEIFGGPDLESMVNMSVRFIDAVGDTLTRLVSQLAGFAGEMDEDTARGAEALGGMLNGVASLIQALSGPFEEVMSDHGLLDSMAELIGGPGVQEKLASIVTGMTQMLNALSGSLPALARSMKSALSQMPEDADSKAKAFGSMLSGVAAAMDMWDQYDNKISERESERGMGPEGGYAFRESSFARDMEGITDILNWEGWGPMAQAMSNAGSVTFDLPALENFADGVLEVGRLAQRTTTGLDRIWDSGIMDWDTVAVEAAVSRVAAVVASYNRTAASLASISPINIDAVLEQVNESLRVRRDNLTIEDGHVTINMSLNVTMKAEDVAIPLIEEDLVVRGSSSKVQNLGNNTA